MADIPEFTRLRILEEEHYKKIQLYKHKIEKYENLIKKEIDTFKPNAEKLKKERHKEHINYLAKICQSDLIVLMNDSIDLKPLRKRGIQITPISIDVQYRGSHRLDNDNHLIKDSLELDKSTLHIQNDEYDLIVIRGDDTDRGLSIINHVENCLGDIDTQSLMNLLKYDYDSLCCGTWTGTIDMCIVGKYKKLTKPSF